MDEHGGSLRGSVGQVEDYIQIALHSQNPEAEPAELRVDGQKVPYLEVRRLAPTHWEVLQEYGADELETVYSLTLDDRFGLTCRESELKKWIGFMANAMAVSAGRTSHGPNSAPRNPHGANDWAQSVSTEEEKRRD